MKIHHAVYKLSQITDKDKATLYFEGMHVFFTMLREGIGAEVTPAELAFLTGMTEEESERGLKWCLDNERIITEGAPLD